MAVDEDYAPEADDINIDDDEDDIDRPGPSRQRKGKGRANGQTGGDGMQTWEGAYTRSWDVIQEDDEEGGLQSTVEKLLARGRRKRAMAGEGPIRRSIIRHMFIILDLSESMRDKDFRPTRWEVTLQYLRGYIGEWFDQNPLGQIGIVLMRDRLSETLIPMGGNPQEILAALADKRKLEPSGEPSLQNGLTMAKGGMGHLPVTSSLEILVIFSSISTADPDGPTSIQQTMKDLVQSRVRTTIISLSGEIKICKQISERTGGKFGVAMDEDHLRELLWETIPPPAQTIAAPLTVGVRNALAAGGVGTGAGGRNKPAPAGDLMVMGFPVRLPLGGETMCVCHGILKKGGYLCPRCGSKLCDVPTDCEVCGLMVVSSPHLARSFWFLFPVAEYGVTPADTVQEDHTSRRLEPTCFGCDDPFPLLDEIAVSAGVNQVDEAVSPTGRYRCAKCKNDFCVNCDIYVHHTLHTCPGCAQ
ncbi:Ssl1-like-domain-containing protein [Kockovaella imperatae]|uniref:General transcription and DNA repair factor IIH n=1 Tax=Kockovaella imperatae TaxID=4999 RepID=A0A1Y1UN41_9TREE|nr:Ssl1-like-domain-containing protein [Kockovaella imperatae]ORX39429.1 Ssl1-like-domain-containing protein [Kockovaella imperatae]